MTQTTPTNRRFALLGLILISLGVNFVIIFQGSMQTMGFISLGVGVLFVVIALIQRNKETEK